MAKTVEVTIIARVRVPDSWRLGDMSVDKNMVIQMQHHELGDYQHLTTPFQPRVLTLAHSVRPEQCSDDCTCGKAARRGPFHNHECPVFLRWSNR